MKIALATAQHLVIVEVEKTPDDATRNWQIVDTDVLLSGQTFATVAETPEGGLFTISHRDTVGSRGGKMQDMYITQFNPDGGILDRGHEPWLRHAHTAEFLEDGTLAITNTAFNKVELIRGGQRGGFYIGPEDEDTHHLNATWGDGSDLYVMAHNGNLPEEVPGQIFHVDLDAGEVVEVIELPHRKCHHMFKYTGEAGHEWWYYTASDGGRLARFWSNNDGGVVETICVGGFPKGLQRVSDDLAVFTTSEHTPFIERRVEAYCELGFLDLNSFEVTERLVVQVANVPCGQANDICVLDADVS